MTDDLGRCNSPYDRTLADGSARAESVQEPSGKQISRTGRINHALHRFGWDFEDLPGTANQATRSATGNGYDPAIILGMLQCSFDLFGLIEAGQLSLIRKQHVDVVLHELTEAVAIPIHTETVGE